MHSTPHHHGQQHKPPRAPFAADRALVLRCVVGEGPPRQAMSALPQQTSRTAASELGLASAAWLLVRDGAATAGTPPQTLMERAGLVGFALILSLAMSRALWMIG